MGAIVAGSEWSRVRAMEANCSKLTERILQLTLEIIYLLTGEDNIVAKRTSADGQNCVMIPLQSLLIPPRNNEQKIVEVTKKMMELLTGESGNWSNFNVRIKEEIKEEEEELEYLEAHKDIMKASQPALTSPDGSSNENPPERCPRPLYSRDSTQEDLTIPHHHQEEEVFEIKTEIKEEEEEIYVGGNQLSMMEAEMMVTITKEESTLDDSTEGHNIWNTSEGRLILSADYTKEDFEIAQYSPGVSNVTQNVHSDLNDMERTADGFNSKEQDELHTILPNVQPSFQSADRPPDLSNPEESSSSSDLALPTKNHTNQFSCPQCDRTFIKRSNLFQHQRVHTGEKPFSCSECAKGFSSKGNRDNHMRIHTGEKPFSCPECGESFAQKVTLILHQRTHTTQGPCLDQDTELQNRLALTCLECGESFEKIAELHVHQTSHAGQEVFSCRDCDRKFLTAYDLVVHQKSHSGEPRYSCTECNKSFKDSYKLVQHQRIHTWEKPFTCSVCGKSFTQKSQLKTHQIVHTGEKPFSCSECGKCFPSKGNRDKHMRIHTGEKPFPCPECGKCFAQKVTLIIHQRTHT